MGPGVTLIIVLAAAYAAFVYFIAGILGVNVVVSQVPAILFVLTIVGVLKHYKNPIVKAWPLQAKLNKYVTILVAVGLAMSIPMTSGIISQIPGLNMLQAAFTGTAAFVPSPQAPTAVDVAACKASITNPDIIGRVSTATVNAYDQEASDPTAAAVDAGIIIVDSKGAIIESADTTAYSLASYTVGDVLKIYGSGASYYTDYVEVCLDTQAFPLNLDSHAIAGVTDIDVTCLDADGNACSAGTNTTQEEYDFTLGASESAELTLKLRVKTANKAFNHLGIVTLARNDIDDFEVVETAYSTGHAMPKAFRNVPVDDNAQSSTNFTDDFDRLYKLAAPIMMTEWDEQYVDAIITAGVTDPTNTDVFEDSDVALVCFLDATGEREGNEIFVDITDHSENEANIGLDERVYAPIVSTACTMIEGI